MQNWYLYDLYIDCIYIDLDVKKNAQAIFRVGKAVSSVQQNINI